MLEKLKLEVIDAGKKLKEYKLITLTGGNVSGRDLETGYIVMTPSGMEYDTLTPDDMTETL